MVQFKEKFAAIASPRNGRTAATPPQPTDVARSSTALAMLRPSILLRGVLLGAIATVAIGAAAPPGTSPQQQRSETGRAPVKVDGFNPNELPVQRTDAPASAKGDTPTKSSAAAKPAAAKPAAAQSPKPSPPPAPSAQGEKEFWMANAPGQSQKFDLNQSLKVYSQLYQSPTSLGVVAVGLAEGNYTMSIQGGNLYVQPTGNYYGHTDPGNLSWGERVTNYGPCSDQGRSRGNIAVAERMCVERLRDRLPTLLVDLNAAGVDPYADLPALLNAADLYNQASPVHSRWFPHALAIAKRGGLYGIQAYAWARTASFYLDENDRLNVERGTNRAGGLLGICARDGRAATQWDCVYADQMRRVRAIASAYDHFLKVSGNQG